MQAIFYGTYWFRFCKKMWKGTISRELAMLWKWWRWRYTQRMVGDFYLDYVNDMSYHII
jgi:hypothetical protein